MACINLRERFGDQYRISFDPAYDHRGVPREKLDPWMMQAPCRFGVIFPHGGNVLAVEIDGHPRIARQLAALTGVRVHQRGEGDQEVTLLFDVAMFTEVAAIVHPHRKPQMSDQQRQEAVARLRSFQFRPAAPTGFQAHATGVEGSR